jgi:hypothetical protein
MSTEKNIAMASSSILEDARSWSLSRSPSTFRDKHSSTAGRCSPTTDL